MHNIIFLFSGQSRTSPFNIDYSKRKNVILDSYNKYIFTENFKSLYNYKIYITTDDIHLQDTINYFSIENIGNIHTLKTGFYLKPITKNINTIDYYLDSYNKKDWSNYRKYVNSIHQHYKILDCYNLFRNDDLYNTNDTYIVRMRLDTVINKNILDILSLFNNNHDLKISMCWDFFALGTFKIMECYCTGLENNYGNYNYLTIVPDNVPIMVDYKKMDKKKWTYAPERQLLEMLFEYCNVNNIDINKAMCNIHGNVKIIR
jgi:hypothetical protein